MVESLEAGGGADFLLEPVDRTGGVDRGDRSALGADEVVAVLAGDDEGEVCGTFVKPEAPDDAFVGEAVEESVEGGLVAKGDEAGGFGEFREGHGAPGVKEAAEKFLKGLGPTQTGMAAAAEGIDRWN